MNFKKLYPYVLLIGLISCNNNSESSVTTPIPATSQLAIVDSIITPNKQEEVIDLPFENLNPTSQRFELDSRKKNTLELPSGTSIEIPDNCFEDQNGTPVTSEVIVSYREFHSLADIMASGIKMTYANGDFESAGMFEIRAFADDEEVRLREGKSISVDMASYKSGDFDSFYMNETAENWEILPKSNIKPNTKKQEKLAELAKQEANIQKVCEAAPIKYTNGMDIVDLNYNINTYKGMEMFEGAQWILVGTDEEKKDFKADQTAYTDMEISPTDVCNTFELELFRKSNNPAMDKSKKYTISPVYGGKEYDRAKKNYKQLIANFKQEYQKFLQERKVVRQEADLIRSFEVKKMGIYNCDRLLDFLKLVTVGISLKCIHQIKSWWYITHDKQVAIKYYNPTTNDFKVNLASANSIVMVLENGELATVSETEFQSAMADYDKNSNPDKVLEITVKTETEKRIKKQADLELAIQTL